MLNNMKKIVVCAALRFFEHKWKYLKTPSDKECHN